MSVGVYYPRRRRPLAERFWAKVNKAGRVVRPELGPCWEWTGSTNRKGYGQISGGGSEAPKLAHRVAWEMTNGPIPDGKYVCHHCDNPPCVRGEHLFLGTIEDNNADMHAKGRASGGSMPGEKSWRAQLSDAEVLAMRQRFAADDAKTAASEYGISYQNAWLILTRRSWRHLP